MNRRTFVVAIGAVCAFPTALFAKTKPNVLAEYEGFRAVDLGFLPDTFFQWVGIDYPGRPHGGKTSIFIPISWWQRHTPASRQWALLSLLAHLSRGPYSCTTEIIHRWHDYHQTYSETDLNRLNKTFGALYEKYPNLGTRP